MNGGAGNDVLIASSQADIMPGGAGAARFVCRSTSDKLGGLGLDHIDDFARQQGDKIDLSSLFSGTLTFTGRFAFSGEAAMFSISMRRAMAPSALSATSSSISMLDTDGAIDLLAQDFVL